MKNEAHLFLFITFVVVVMLLWLVLGVEWSGPAPGYRRIGGGLLAWIAVAVLGYIQFG